MEGTLFDEEVEGALGSAAPVAGLPRFAECQFETTYPFGRVALPDPNFPELQVGDGCVADQLVGDTYAQLTGLPPVLDPEHVKSALSSIHNLNYVPDFGDWTNYMRTYAAKGERGHTVLSYPRGRPEHPMPYWCEAWTSFEYVYAIGLVRAGLGERAEDAVAAALERFSGKRRNPFDEAECGHHCARAMASWGLVPAFTGVGYDGRKAVMTFARSWDGAKWFWSTGLACGTVQQSLANDGKLLAQLDVFGRASAC